jgi:glycosyltransferase involved in cell wall biosynthesis
VCANTEQSKVVLPPYSVAAITGGINVPSRRYRIEAVIPFLASQNIKVTEYCPVLKRYPPLNKWLRWPWFIAAFIERLSYIYRVNHFDAVILQRELISTLPTIEHLIPGRKILDIDDAIFLHRGGRAAKHAAVSSFGVVCGNGYLAEHFSKWNERIAIIPTGVDIERMKPWFSHIKPDRKRIGWIGTSGNMKYLEPMAKSILRATKVVPNAEFHIIADSMASVPQELRSITHFTPWYPGIEYVEVPKWHVGLMPLHDGKWERGKCAFKLLQYLAAGVPAIASPVGMNIDVLSNQKSGFLAKGSKAWETAIIDILTDDSGAEEMGINGRKLVEEQYSLTVVSTKWRELFDEWLGGV